VHLHQLFREEKSQARSSLVTASPADLAKLLEQTLEIIFVKSTSRIHHVEVEEAGMVSARHGIRSRGSVTE
jgi:hypothetical protein